MHTGDVADCAGGEMQRESDVRQLKVIRRPRLCALINGAVQPVFGWLAFDSYAVFLLWHFAPFIMIVKVFNVNNMHAAFSDSA